MAWFAVAKNLFACQNILSEDVKFNCIINALEAKHIKKISHLLIGNSVVAPYQSLKQALLKTFEASENFKLNNLITFRYRPRPQFKTPDRTLFRNARSTGTAIAPRSSG